jgi:hypothetical protein
MKVQPLLSESSFVMPALLAGIHVLAIFLRGKTWMAGSSPAMTMRRTRMHLLRHCERSEAIQFAAAVRAD